MIPADEFFYRETGCTRLLSGTSKSLAKRSRTCLRSLKKSTPGPTKKKIAGFRDVLTHTCFGIKPAILWDNATNKLPLLKKEIRHILKSEESRK